MAKGSVDIIVPVYNPSSFFVPVMDSLLSQTHDDFQIILVNDASTIGLELIDSYRADHRIEVVDLDCNTGGGGARNVALEITSADFVAFCDSDDVWPVDKLARQVEFMFQSKSDVSHTDIIRVSTSGETYVGTPREIDLVEFLTGTNLYCSTVCVRGELARSFKFGQMRKRHPFRYWVNLLQNGYVSRRVPEVAVRYIHRSDSVSSKRYSTLAYTIAAYFIYPRSKWLALKCLIHRARKALAGESRISTG